jgi:hypothetical protein
MRAMITLGVFGFVGLAAAWFLPANPTPQAGGAAPEHVTGA